MNDPLTNLSNEAEAHVNYRYTCTSSAEHADPESMSDALAKHIFDKLGIKASVKPTYEFYHDPYDEDDDEDDEDEFRGPHGGYDEVFEIELELPVSFNALNDAIDYDGDEHGFGNGGILEPDDEKINEHTKMKTFKQWLHEINKVGLIIAPGKEFTSQIKDPRTGQMVDKKYKYKQQKDEGGKITHVLTTSQKDAAGKDITTEETFADDTFRNTFAIPVR